MTSATPRSARPSARLLCMLVFAVACGSPASRPAHASGPATLAAPRVLARSAPLRPIDGSNAARLTLVWEAAVGGYGKSVAISRTLGRGIAVSGEQTLAFALADGKKTASIAACRDPLRSGVRLDARRLVLACETSVEVRDPRTFAKLVGPEVAASTIHAAALTATHVALGHDDGVIRVLSLEGKPPIEVPVPGPPIPVKTLALSADARFLAVAWVQGSIWWWDLSSPTLPQRLVRHSNESDALVFDGTGSLLAEEGQPNETAVWTFPPGPQAKPSARLRNGAWVKQLAFSQDSKWLFRGGSDGLELAELSGPRRVVLDNGAQVEDLALDEARASVAAIDRNGRLAYWALR